MTRQYLPTLADLVDRLSIVQLKAINIAENKSAYDAEMQAIMHDIDLLLDGKHVDAHAIRAIMVVMLANHFIWTNEAKARMGGKEQNEMLRWTHAVNGVRNTAKNILSAQMDERLDLKVDCLAADLPPELGNWNIFG